MAPPATSQSRARTQAQKAQVFNLPSIDDLGRAGNKFVDSARNHAIQARARLLFYDRWGRMHGTLRGAPEAFQVKLDEIVRERDPHRAAALVEILTEQKAPPPSSRSVKVQASGRATEVPRKPVKQVAYAPQGGYYNSSDAWRNFKRPFDDANAAIDAHVSVPMMRRAGNLARGDWKGIIDD